MAFHLDISRSACEMREEPGQGSPRARAGYLEDQEEEKEEEEGEEEEEEEEEEEGSPLINPH